MELNTVSTMVKRCPMCDWAMTFPNTADYNDAVQQEISRHIENVHGYISVLKHEYELHGAVESAYRRGRDEGRKMIREELTAIIERVLNER